jgi:hypothetical protein
MFGCSRGPPAGRCRSWPPKRQRLDGVRPRSLDHRAGWNGLRRSQGGTTSNPRLCGAQHRVRGILNPRSRSRLFLLPRQVGTSHFLAACRAHSSEVTVHDGAEGRVSPAEIRAHCDKLGASGGAPIGLVLAAGPGGVVSACRCRRPARRDRSIWGVVGAYLAPGDPRGPNGPTTTLRIADNLSESPTLPERAALAVLGKAAGSFVRISSRYAAVSECRVDQSPGEGTSSGQPSATFQNVPSPGAQAAAAAGMYATFGTRTSGSLRLRPRHRQRPLGPRGAELGDPSVHRLAQTAHRQRKLRGISWLTKGRLTRHYVSSGRRPRAVGRAGHLAYCRYGPFYRLRPQPCDGRSHRSGTPRQES